MIPVTITIETRAKTPQEAKQFVVDILESPTGGMRLAKALLSGKGESLLDLQGIHLH